MLINPINLTSIKSDRALQVSNKFLPLFFRVLGMARILSQESEGREGADAGLSVAAVPAHIQLQPPRRHHPGALPHAGSDYCNCMATKKSAELYGAKSNFARAKINCLMCL